MQDFGNEILMIKNSMVSLSSTEIRICALTKERKALLSFTTQFHPEFNSTPRRTSGRGVKLDPTADAKGDSAAAAAGRVNIMTLIVNPDR